MSKRFGRNQRRAMREMIVEKDWQIAVSNEMFSEVSNRSATRKREADELRGRLETWARDVMQLMGEDSAFNERVRRMTVDDRYADMGRMQLSPIVNFPPIVLGVEPMAATVQTVINALIWRLHMSRDEFRPMIRIELENRFKQPVGYALSEEHRWTQRDIDYLSRRIAGELVLFMGKAA